MMSGIASADFKIYKVNNDSLTVSYQRAQDTTGVYKRLESYPISNNQLNRLDTLLAKTDSLGDHTTGAFILGWPRFFIDARYEGKEYEGYIANCYREHIFVFVDWLNDVYPEGEVINYDKEELLAREHTNKLEWE